MNWGSEQRVADPLAVQILDGRIENGERVLVDSVGGELMFTVVEKLVA